MILRPRIMTAMLIAVLLGPMQAVHAQKSTEIFIPIGKSPGLSGTRTMIGRIDCVEVEDRLLMVRGADRRRYARLTDETQIWLDRSPLRRTNVYGLPDDCERGRFCELKYTDNDPGDRDNPGTIEWIKIQIDESTPARRRGRAAAPGPVEQSVTRMSRLAVMAPTCPAAPRPL